MASASVARTPRRSSASFASTCADTVNRMRKLRPVVLHQVSNFSSALGNSIVVITVPWLVLERTGSPTFAGLVAAVSALPAIFVSPLGGWLADHIGRRVVSIGADLLSALSVAAFPIAALTVGLSDSLILLIAIAGATFDPAGYTARKTMLADVAKASKIGLDRLNGIHEGFMGIAWIFGPAIGAGLIATVGSINSFWASTVLFVVGALAAALLRIGDSGTDARRLAATSGVKGAAASWLALRRSGATSCSERSARRCSFWQPSIFQRNPLCSPRTLRAPTTLARSALWSLPLQREGRSVHLDSGGSARAFSERTSFG